MTHLEQQIRARQASRRAAAGTLGMGLLSFLIAYSAETVGASIVMYGAGLGLMVIAGITAQGA